MRLTIKRLQITGEIKNRFEGICISYAKEIERRQTTIVIQIIWINSITNQKLKIATTTTK